MIFFMIFPKKQLEWTLEVGFFLIFVIFVFHGPWIMHWVFWKVLIVKAITPSILVRFSKFLCLNTSAFQDLSFSFTAHPPGTCPHGQKRVLRWVHEKQKLKKFKKILLAPWKFWFWIMDLNRKKMWSYCSSNLAIFHRILAQNTSKWLDR